MAHYIHHVPGRLRVRTLAIKRNEARARSVKEYLAGMHGVLATEISTVTGSVVVNYDTALLDSTTILNSLHAMGFVAHTAPQNNARVSSNGAGFGQKLSDTVLTKVVETVFERSAVALIAALI